VISAGECEAFGLNCAGKFQRDQLLSVAHGPGVATARATIFTVEAEVWTTPPLTAGRSPATCPGLHLNCDQEGDMATSSTARAAKWRKDNPERAREISRDYYARRKAKGHKPLAVKSRKVQRINNPEKSLFRSTKQRAARMGIPFDLTVSDIIIPESCPVFAKPIIIFPFRHEFGPSVDRIIPSLGYVKGNIQVISMKANRLKSNGDLESFKAIVAYIEKHLPPDIGSSVD
jgi:hypothetical protein